MPDWKLPKHSKPTLQDRNYLSIDKIDYNLDRAQRKLDIKPLTAARDNNKPQLHDLIFICKF